MSREYDPKSYADRLDVLFGTFDTPVAPICPKCHGEGVTHTGIDENPTTQFGKCDGTGLATLPAAPAPTEQQDELPITRSTYGSLEACEAEQARRNAAPTEQAEELPQPMRVEFERPHGLVQLEYYTAEQMRQQRYEGRRDAHETNITLLGENCKLAERLEWHRNSLTATSGKLVSVWDGIREAVEKYSDKPCEGEPFDRLDELLAALAARQAPTDALKEPSLMDNLRKNDPAFAAHLDRCSADVATWPKWKQMGYAEDAARPAPAESAKKEAPHLTEQQVADMMKPEMMTDIGYRAMLNGERILLDLPWMTGFANFILAARQAPDSRDAEILDWLQTKCVNVRDPLRYGSRDMFWASPEDLDGDSGPSDLRQQCSTAIAKEKSQ